ncbi:hypothetical protein D1006_35035 [Burkholderia stabilis]|uniref:Uncharacterized protein n=2 Tax=Burkholderia stabilis TaxID=95485 RepID=A0A4Q2A932_9BURK|nr:hypothetical protein D1006_35035 [Burkholderia stabilis]
MVEVDAIEFQPDQPTYRDLQGVNRNILNCLSLDFDGANHAVLVDVPDLTAYGLGDGDVVTMTWVAYAGLPGGGGAEVARLVEPITLDSVTAKGFVWRVEPYEDYILPTYDPPPGAGTAGHASTTYSYLSGSETITSHPADAIVAMFDAAGSCPLT